MNKIKKAIEPVGMLALYAFALIWNLPKTIKRKFFAGKPILTSRRAIAISLALIMAITAMPLSGVAVNAADNDIVLNTETDTYEIYTAKGLSDFRDMVNAGETAINAKLMDNIDLSTVCGADVGGEQVNWIPIGNSSYVYTGFDGTFDGNNKTVSGMYINGDMSDQGFFKYVWRNGVIKDLNLVGNITLTSSAALCGSIAVRSYGLIENCTFSGEINAKGAGIGGLVDSNVYGTIRNCVNNAKITVTGVSGFRVGGIVESNSSGTITGCINNGEIYAPNIDYIGGIAGYSDYTDSVFENCYNTAKMNGKTTVGGIIGNFSSGKIKNCYNLGALTCTDSSVGGISGTAKNDSTTIENSYYLDTCVSNGIAYDGVTAKTEAEMKTSAFITALNGTDTAFVSDIMNINDGYPILSFQLPTLDGEGTVESPYLIYTAEQLSYFSALVNLGKKSISAKLMDDIDLSTVCGADVGGSEVNWTPIGTDTQKYNGTFDGNGKKISNLYVNSNLNNIGLFGFSGTNSIIKNLSVSGDVRGCAFIGGIISDNCGLIDNCSVSGSFTATYCYIGGIAFSNSGTIKNCINNATVKVSSRDGYQAGGIAGYNSELITDCINNGMVIAECIVSIGGIAGTCEDESTIKNCYNTAKITGYINVGGIVGQLLSATMENCYNVGNITGAGDYGGVVGNFNTQNVNNKITSSYYLDSCVTDGNTIDGVTAKNENAFIGGEVAKLLGDAFGQMITGDTKDIYPVFRADDNSKQVFSVSFKLINEDIKKTVYTNYDKTIAIPDEFKSYTNFIDQDNNTFVATQKITKDTVVTALPTATYTVIIPASLDFGNVERKSEKSTNKIKRIDDITVAAETSNLFDNKKILTVKLSSDFLLTSGENELTYEMYDEKDTLLKTGDNILNLNYTENDTDKVTTAKLNARLDQSKIKAGVEYTGALTFTIAMLEAE